MTRSMKLDSRPLSTPPTLIKIQLRILYKCQRSLRHVLFTRNYVVTSFGQKAGVLVSFVPILILDIMAENVVKALNRKLSYVKARLTNFRRFIETLSPSTASDRENVRESSSTTDLDLQLPYNLITQTQYEQLKKWLQTSQSLFSDYEKLNDALLEAEDDANIQTRYVEFKKRLRE
ncbi:hypothetical protein ABEB36_012873 [Hypothenemus hampei]|uniref:Uncharacterized protein n=1 Tax=Hypothenemus hampei TaxID=57062 RepID=A0ABD1E624_HYPHA